MNRSNIQKILLPAMFTVVLFSLLITGCSKQESQNKSENTGQSKQQSEQIDSLQIDLPTMQCEKCKKTIESAVGKMDGIREITVSVKDKFAHIDYEKSKIDISQIENAITSAGYDANDKKADPEAYENLKDCCKLPKDRADTK